MYAIRFVYMRSGGPVSRADDARNPTDHGVQTRDTPRRHGAHGGAVGRFNELLQRGGRGVEG